MGSHCRFHPTCSAYMAEAIQAQGSIRGSILGIKRIFKCQPFYKGDFIDPVPEVSDVGQTKSIASKGWFGYKRKHSQTRSIKK